MRKKILLICLIIPFLVASIACNLPVAGSDPADTDPAAASTPASTDTPTGPTSTPSPAFTPTPIPTPPPGWSEQTSAELGITLYLPDGWQIIFFDDHKIEVREVEGFAWAEISRITPGNADSWGITYTAGDDSITLITIFYDALRQDGTYSEPEPLTTIEGRSIAIFQGENNLLEDHLFVGVLGLSDSALLLKGHDSLEENDWENRLNPIYRQIMISLKPLQ